MCLFLQDPEFYQYLKDFDKELLDFNDEEFDVSIFCIPVATTWDKIIYII